MKKYVYEGGVADPCIIAAPWLISDPGGIRLQYHHVTDIAPAVLDLVGVTQPAALNGVEQSPVDGVSMAYALRDGRQPTARTMQYYESMGHRGLWKSGWKLVSDHVPQSGRGHYEQDSWELYHVDTDSNESRDLSAEEPGMLAEMIEAWRAEAERNNVLSLDDSSTRDPLYPTPVDQVTSIRIYPGGSGVPQWASLPVRKSSHAVTAVFGEPVGPGAEGTLFVQGGRFGGFGIFLRDGALHYVYNYADADRFLVRGELPPRPLSSLGVRVRLDEDTAALVELLADDEVVANGVLPRTLRLRYDAEGAMFAGRDPFGVIDVSGAEPPLGAPPELSHVELRTFGGGRSELTAW